MESENKKVKLLKPKYDKYFKHYFKETRRI